MVIVSIAVVLPLLAPRRVLVFLVQVVTTFVLASTTDPAAFSAHDTVVLSLASAARSPVVVVTVVIADQISLMNHVLW